MTSDAACVLAPGPWAHRYVSANGARFHIADCGSSGPLVLFLHGFPQFWWTWRRQLVAVADAGYRSVAMDLRGFGASDKPPAGYDARTLAADVDAVIRSLGASHAVVVGHGMGGWLAWALPTLFPGVVSGLAAVASPHPRTYLHASLTSWPQIAANRHLLPVYRPYLPEQHMTRDPAYVHLLLRKWAAPGSSWPDPDTSDRYAQAMAMPFAAHCALDAYRWMLAAPVRMDGRRFLQDLAKPVTVPVLAVHGDRDRVFPPEMARRSEQYAADGYEWRPIPGAGHFVHEEASAATSEVLIRWLARLP